MIDIADYIEPTYNQRRRHSTLGNISPVEYELKYQQTATKPLNLCRRLLDHYSFTIENHLNQLNPMVFEKLQSGSQ